MPVAQWILYDQFHQSYIEPGVTDILFILFTGESVTSPVGRLKFNIRSKIAEYAMAKSFLKSCQESGYSIHWIEAKNYTEGLDQFIVKTGITEIISMRSSEEYLARKIDGYRLQKGSLTICKNRQFLIDWEEFQAKFKTPPVMETFYRYMRTSRNILLDEAGKPLGGKWNYDHENRSFDKNHLPTWNWKPEDVWEIKLAKTYYWCENIEFHLPVSRKDSLSLLQYFLEYHFSNFGALEDAMYQEDAKVHHSLLSCSINFWLLTPKEVIDAARGCEAPLPSKEGFIRQILGWREYMRQFYLHYSNSLYANNVLGHHESIPKKWWNYDGVLPENPPDLTGLNCVDTVIQRVHREHYSHHIERLMVIGNFALLRGYHPHEVNRWFWEMYTDAFEWVVSPNVLGMSQYSDGGKLATKPYISWGNYIEKMSNFCQNCTYSIKEKTCPMTHLYWDFVDRNQDIFRKWRTPYVLSSLAKIDIEKIKKAKAAFIQKTSSDV